MTEIRTTSATGGQKGVKPQRYDLMPKEGLDAVAELFGYGAMKYADHNWRNGYEWSKGIAAMERHGQAHKNGETYDYCPDDCPMVADEWCKEHSRLEHLAAVGFHALVGLTWLRTQGEGPDNPFDDRWPAAMERRRREVEQEAAEQAEALDGFHLPHRYVSDVPSGTGDLTDLEPDVERFRRKAEEEGVTLEKAADLHDLTLPFEDAASEEPGQFARIWIQHWGPEAQTVEAVSRDVCRELARAQQRKPEIPTEDLRM